MVLAKVGGIEREEPGLPIPSRAVDAPFVGKTRKAAAKKKEDKERHRRGRGGERKAERAAHQPPPNHPKRPKESAA